jgi:hypothetical protein
MVQPHFGVSAIRFIAMPVMCEGHYDLGEQFCVLMCMQKNINVQEAEVPHLIIQIFSVLKSAQDHKTPVANNM